MSGTSITEFSCGCKLIYTVDWYSNPFAKRFTRTSHRMDDKVEHCLAASHSPTPSQQKESPSLSEQEDTLRNNEILEKIINLFKLKTTKEMRTLEVAKACIGQNATKRDINRYLYRLAGAGVVRVTYKKETKSDPRWSAVPEINDISEKKIKGLATEIKSSSQNALKSVLGKKRLDQPEATYRKPFDNKDTTASKIARTGDTTRSKSTMYAPAHPFSKGTHNQKDVLPSIIRAIVSESVGLIQIDGQPVGTGFRVGEKYLVTCRHVIQNVIKVKPHMLDEDRLTIEFYRIKHNQKENTLLIFGFQPLIVYFDDEHDFVVLELRSHYAGVPFPPALTCFAKVAVSDIHLLGHPGGRQMKEDSIVPRWSPDHDEEIIPYINELAHWSRNYFPDKKDYYSILLEPPRKIMFHTTFDTGSSGSPGVMIRNSRPCVVVIVRGGTPSCFYKKLYQYLPVEDNHKVEYGYAMSDIYLKMFNSTQQNIRDLASEIFREWI